MIPERATLEECLEYLSSQNDSSYDFFKASSNKRMISALAKKDVRFCESVLMFFYDDMFRDEVLAALKEYHTPDITDLYFLQLGVALWYSEIMSDYSPL